MKQFANLSPIDLNQNSLTNKKMMKSMSTVDFTLFETKADYSDENDDQEEEGYDDENSHDMTSSLVLFSPEKEKEELNQNSLTKNGYTQSSSVLSSNEIESAMTCVSSLSITNNNSSLIQRRMRKNPSTLEPIEDMSINDEINDSNNLSIFNEQNNGSMASFEQHELTQCTPMSSHLKAQSNSTPMSNRMNDLSHQSSDVRNYFDNLVSSTSRIHTNNHNPSHKEEEDMTILAEKD